MQDAGNYRKKLIEVALPLNAISEASVREKSIRHGHPSTLHLWWSRKPLATCRAVLFASIVDDPSEHPEQFPTEAEQDTERQRLFQLIEELIQWENSNDQRVLARAQAEIKKSTGDKLPAFLDPFAGGGSIPLEAQRLDLEAHASDLNPVAVLIEKALIEIPPKFANRPPISLQENQLFKNQENDWKGAHGLAEDIRYYGKWMRDEAERRIGYLYPKAKLPDGSEATVIAWLWVRTVTCPNPACGARMPLTSKWWLSKKKGKETWAEPVIDYAAKPPTISFVVKTGLGKPQDGTVNRQGAKCLACGANVPFEYVRSEGQAARMGSQLMAIVAESSNGRVYLAPNPTHATIAAQATPASEVPVTNLPEEALGFRIQNYGMTQHRDLFTSRQLVALTTFSDLVQEVRQRVLADAVTAGLPDDARPLHVGGHGAQAYADAVTTYLAIAVDKGADYWSSICSWHSGRDTIRNTFARQAIPMVWDFAEANPLSDSTGNFQGAIDWVAEVIAETPSETPGNVTQRDATASMNGVAQPMISTDPPYYDNIGYADLSDFFYVWLRRSLAGVYPDIFRTMLVPKKQELIAAPYRFGGNKSQAQEFFESGLNQAFERMLAVLHPDYPLTVYYAFKQSEAETDNEEEDQKQPGRNGKDTSSIASTGWETMLEGMIRAGFSIIGTWPLRTELANRTRGIASNALASSIVLVCRPRPTNAPIASRREFLLALKRELPEKLRKLQHGGIAPVDLAQASIGPGMSIYSRYRQVVEADGTPLRVRTALQMINQDLDAALAEQEGEYENETRWAIAWFEQYGMQEGAYGVAETLSKAKNMSVAHLETMGLVASRAGKVRLLRREELPAAWEPRESTVWEVTQRLIYTLLEDKSGQAGEGGAARILRQALALSESVRDLTYRLYTVCERQGWAQDALAYNALITSWTQITELANKGQASIEQEKMF